MEHAMEERKLNFLEEIIEADLASGKVDSVMTRFPPEPNGYLHLGHAKSICLNFGLAEKYGGKTNLRYDDTNPTKEDTEYVDSIKEDIQWLGFQWDKELYASDYFDQLYEWAEDLIKRGLAYVDDQTQEEIRLNRGTVDKPGTPSPWRDRTPEENLKLFREMKAGKYAEGEKVLRPLVQLVEIVRRVEFLVPLEAEPLDVLLDGVHVFGVLLGGVRVVVAEVRLAAVFLREAEVQTDRLCVSQVQVAVRLRRETRHHVVHFARSEVRFDDLFEEIQFAFFHGLLPYREQRYAF